MARQCVRSPALMLSRPLHWSLRSLCPGCSGQRYTGEEGRLLSAPDGNRHRDSPPHGGAQSAAIAARQRWLSVPVAVKPVWTVQPVKNPAARVA